MKKLELQIDNILNVFDLYNNILSLNSVITVLSEYYLATAILSMAIFFSILPKIKQKSFNQTKFSLFSSISFNFNYLAILIIFFYCFLSIKQNFIFLSDFINFNNSLHNDFISLLSKLIISISSLIYLIFVQQFLFDQKLNYFEYYILILTSILGFCLLCCSDDLLTAYLAIELQSLSFYVLASFKKNSNYSVESGVKYFILGSFSTILFLLGCNLVYGLSGSISIIDFKDLFIWTFSTTSFFLSFESISKSLEVFQDKTFTLDYNKDLQIIYDKFLILKNNTLLNTFDLDTVFFEFIDYDVLPSQINMCNNIFKKMWDLYNLINDSSEYYYTNHFNNSLESIYSIPAKKDLISDNLIQNASFWFLTDIQNINNNYVNLINFKQDLFLINLYSNLLNKFEYNWFYIESPIIFLNDFEYINSILIKDLTLKNLNNFLIFNHLFNNLSIFNFISNDNEILEYYQFKNKISTEIFPNIKVDENLSVILGFNAFAFPLFFDFSYTLCNTSNYIFNFSLIELGVFIILISLFFKLALSPFHLWSPDIYEGSPSSSTFFFTVISKLSIFIFLLKICYTSFYSIIVDWQFYSLIIAILSIFIGSIGGLKQRKFKSILAYSSISNMGLILISFSTGSFEGITSFFYFFIIYIISGLSIWSIFLLLKLKKKNYSEKHNKDLGDFGLLHEFNVVLAYSSVITIFTISGIPPMIGFLAKISIFLSLIEVSMYCVALITILASVISTFFYLRILKVIFFENILVGKLFHPTSSKNNIVRSILFFFLLFLFISPTLLNFLVFKTTLFLNKNFY